MFYTLTGASKATGADQVTILRAIEGGKIAAAKDLFGEWHIERAELLRVYPRVAESSAGSDTAQRNAAPNFPLLKSMAWEEMRRIAAQHPLQRPSKRRSKPSSVKPGMVCHDSPMTRARPKQLGGQAEKQHPNPRRPIRSGLPYRPH